MAVSRYSWFISLLLAAAATSASAQTTAYSVNITAIRTGWGIDAFAIEAVGQTIINPANCSVPDSYMTDLTLPGYKTHYAAALLAFSSGRPINVVVNNSACSQSRPMILGLQVPR